MTLAEVSAFIVAAFSAISRVMHSVEVAGIPLGIWFVFYLLAAGVIGMLFDTDVPGSASEGSTFGRKKYSRGGRSK